MGVKEINLVEFNEILFSRQLAKTLYELEIKSELKSDVKICFNFKGVRTVTHSFADELFKILFDNIGSENIRSRTGFINYNDFNKAILTFALNDNRKRVSKKQKSTK